MNTKTTVIAVALGYWGKGPSINKALAALHKTGCSKKDKILLKCYTGPEEDVWVDDDGSIHYDPRKGELLDLTDYGKLIRVVV